MHREKLLKIGVNTLAIAVLGGSLIYYNLIEKDIPENKLLGVGDACVEFTLSKIAVEEGKYIVSQDTVSYSDYSGKVLILNFWATWCASCIAEIPHFNEFYEEYQAQGVELLIINGEPNTESVLKKMNNPNNQNAESYTLWQSYSATFAKYTSDNDLLKLFGAGTSGALPVTIIVDKTGVIRYAEEGDLSKQQLLDIVSPLLT